jgi:hypothetical protein
MATLRAGGMVNFIAQDAQGHLALAVSTSNPAWNFPGPLDGSDRRRQWW